MSFFVVVPLSWQVNVTDGLFTLGCIVVVEGVIGEGVTTDVEGVHCKIGQLYQSGQYF